MNILRYIFLLLPCLFLSPQLAAQQDTTFRPSVTIGLELSNFARQWLEPETRQMEASLSWEWRENWFFSFEGGSLDIGIERPTHDYSSRGWFLRAGFDYNLFERSARNLHDLILFHFRYGYGQLDHSSSKILLGNPYWGQYQTFLDNELFQAHWLEVGAGIRARVLANFYMGWSIRGRLILSRTADPAMSPYIISGFGPNANNTRAMINYSIYYRFPY